jgi:hypothetical protein
VVLRTSSPPSPSPLVEAVENIEHEPDTSGWGQNDAVALYRHYVRASGERNNSLFKVACLVRDKGFTVDWAIEALAGVHAKEPAPLDQPRESRKQRRKEALRTIISAYQRPPRRRLLPELSEENTPSAEPASRLPHTLRQKLLNRTEGDGCAILRVFEGLRVVGVQPGESFSEAEACAHLEGLVGRHSVRKALAALGPDEQPFFVEQRTSVRFCPAKETAGFFNSDDTPVSAQAVGGSRGGMAECSLPKPAHRPAKRYVMPDAEYWCAWLDISPIGNDPVYREDLASAKAYRQALEREFIKRKPGKHAQGFLAGRIGISTRTLRRYHQEIPIHSAPCFDEYSIGWHNVSGLPPACDVESYEIDLGGCCLVDGDGKKYPAFREIACKLLKKKKRVSHRSQTFNIYWYGDLKEAFPPVRAVEPGYEKRLLPPVASSPVVQAEKVKVPVEKEVVPEKVSPAYIYVKQTYPFAHQPADPPAPKRKRKARKGKYQVPLEDEKAEWVAKQVYEAVEDFSLPNSRRLVDLYGVDAVEPTLRRMRWLAWKEKLYNPAGFLVVAVGLKWRRLHGWFVVQKPVFEGERRPRRRRRG